jgi:hypothetical protein
MLSTGREMFEQDRTRTAAYVRVDRAPAPRAERPIAWHYHPWFRWINPAAPELVAQLATGGWHSVAPARPFTAAEAASRGVAPALFLRIARAAA